MRAKFIETIKKELPQWEQLLKIESMKDHAQGYVTKFNATIKALEAAPESFFVTYKHLSRDVDGIVLMIENGRAK